MTVKQLIRDFLDQIIQLKKEIDSYEDMRENCFFRIDQLELDFDSEKYDDYRLIISECDREIKRCEDMIDNLWERIDQNGGLSVIDKEVLS